MTAPVFDLITKQLGEQVLGSGVAHGILVLDIGPDKVRAVADALKSGHGFDMLLDVTAVDWPDREPRFDVVWHFYSTKHFVRVRVKTRVSASEPVVDTLVPLYGSAKIMERECHEMYGIRFRGNADLRPMLLYEGFVGHPLRKDYPKHQEQPLIAYTGPMGDRP
ncbi:MAG: NADH-quinone oxidoreductase subunit C [Burkholderiaceae bacterium]